MQQGLKRMGKSSKQGGKTTFGQPGLSAQATKVPKQSAPNLSRSTNESLTVEKAVASAEAAGFTAAPQSGEAPAPVSEALLREFFGLLDVLKETRATLEARELAVGARDAALSEGLARLEAERSEAASVLAREEAVLARELAADAGFLARRRELLSGLEAERERLFHELHAHTEARMRDGAEAFERLQGMLEGREAALLARETEVDARTRDLDRRARRLRLDEEDLQAREQDLAALVEARMATERSLASQQVARLVERCGGLEADLEARRHASDILSHETPERTLATRRALEAKVEALQTELASRPTEADMRELEQLRADRVALETRCHQAERQHADERRRYEAITLDINRQEALRDALRAKEKHVELLKAAIDELREDVDKRLAKDRDRPVMPSLSAFDADEDLKAAPRRLWPGDAPLNLARFAEDLRERIGRGSQSQPPLYFATDDLRAMIAGLAMSRMHLYQGMSGIGKSSLPRRFAQAVSGLCETITVQAGWRDRQDLFGYYNSFEKVYHETDFVKALYKAQLPKWKDRIVLVLLDEMNLSHPEQYGADLLDVLERTGEGERRFALHAGLPSGTPQPALLREGHLPLPRNVWFVGTANLDETTRDFADKTYDRSFVLTLPEKPELFRPAASAAEPRDPVDCGSLVNAFEHAASDRRPDAEQALTWLEENLRPALLECRIGWGERFAKQLRQFIPVFCAAGGSWQSGLDRLIATRLLRRLDGRHDLKLEDLKRLKGALAPDRKKNWGPAEHSLRFLERQADRLELTL
jgi:hypothetical protein